MGEAEVELHSFLTSTVDGGEWSALTRKEHPVLTEEVATWASIDTQTLWTKEKPLATAGNQSTIPRLSSTYWSHHTMNYATLAPTDTAFCLLAKSIHNKLFGHIILQNLPPINPTPHLYLRVSWIHTIFYPGSRGRRWRAHPDEGCYDTWWLTGLWSTQAKVEGIMLKAAWHWVAVS